LISIEKVRFIRLSLTFFAFIHQSSIPVFLEQAQKWGLIQISTFIEPTGYFLIAKKR
jgi:hypothetical protein